MAAILSSLPTQSPPCVPSPWVRAADDDGLHVDGGSVASVASTRNAQMLWLLQQLEHDKPSSASSKGELAQGEGAGALRTACVTAVSTAAFVAPKTGAGAADSCAPRCTRKPAPPASDLGADEHAQSASSSIRDVRSSVTEGEASPGADTAAAPEGAVDGKQGANVKPVPSDCAPNIMSDVRPRLPDSLETASRMAAARQRARAMLSTLATSTNVDVLPGSPRHLGAPSDTPATAAASQPVDALGAFPAAAGQPSSRRAGLYMVGYSC